MKLISWNVNGLRACIAKGFQKVLEESQADIFCIQETKMQPGQADLQTAGYKTYFNSAERKGYSGTAVFTKQDPIAVAYGLGIEEHDHEGRVITLEYPGFFLVNVYTPNAQDGLKRLDYRMQWEDAFREYLCGLALKKAVVICGDMNVAATEMDIKNAKANEGNAGFTPEERGKFKQLLEAGFVDTYRYLHPDTVKYSWWSYRFRARERNAGWRLDYFLISNVAKEKVAKADIYTEIMGSDHCPVVLELREF